MLLLRDGLRVVKLEQSGLPKHRRFSFYDQVRARACVRVFVSLQ